MAKKPSTSTFVANITPSSVQMALPAHVVAAAPDPARPGARRQRPANAPAARAPAPKVKLDRNEFTHCVWIGNSAKPKLWLKALNELGPALGGISPRKLQNIHVAELKRVNLKITPTLEE